MKYDNLDTKMIADIAFELSKLQTMKKSLKKSSFFKAKKTTAQEILNNC